MLFSLAHQIFSLLLILSFAFSPVIAFPTVFAQSNADIAAQEAKLKAEYDELQKDIAKWQQVIKDTQNKAGTIQGDITVLNAKIKEAESAIKQKNIAIGQLSKEITNRNTKITELEGKLDKGKQSLAQMIRKTNEIDDYSLIEVLFANKKVSDFFQDLDTFFSVKRAMYEHFAVVREVKASTEVEKEQLDKKKNQEADAKYEVETKKKTIAKSETEKKQLLAVTKQEEKEYKGVLAEREARAAQIRAALFRLRDTEGISFAEALAYAENASAKTGVRAALILAILTQESDLGKNQGSCLVTDIVSGNGVGKNTGSPFEQIMKAPRDTEPFKAITDRLGRDWKLTPVSCPPGAVYKVGRGFGGGMGPSQFIPSTWEIVKGSVAPLAGVTADKLDPWNPEHSFMATGVYMSNRGAGGGGYTAERNAACRYYSGAACTPGRVPANVFYGDQVMAKAESIQDNIDFLKGI